MEKVFNPIDMRETSYQPYMDEMIRSSKLSFKINQTEPFTEAARKLTNDLLQGSLLSSSNIIGPLQIDNGANFKLANNVFINHSLTAMAIGGIEIENNVMIGPEVTLLTANHDFDDHHILLISKIHVKENAWVGARATILPGVTIGKNAVVAGGSVVTKDVPDNTVVGGNPAKILKKLD
ncbi:MULTISPECIES: acyltransferase [Listeria]|uniref:acyltransferase n=1 Tax=Listeria TaxID=1637 RepID=UPI0019426166|nr:MULTISPECIES: DapH/DapD/GlmU-related protein [Listeria]